MEKVTVVGAGLAGSEAAWQVASQGVPVELFEMRPGKRTKAHQTGDLAELVCSNSFRGAALSNAVGLLKEELRVANSLIMRCADQAQIPAGGALAVDRKLFSSLVTKEVCSHPLISFHRKEVSSFPEFSPSNPLIISTGPLTSESLAATISNFIGEKSLAFFDAISPIITKESLDMGVLFRQSRYDKGGDDYLNCPLSEEQYRQFIDAVAKAETFSAHSEADGELEQQLRPFEGCMPIEDMLARGPNTLLFGPLKPVGLRDPRTGTRPFAVIQLRQDDKAGELWSMVGFQTRMKHGEQLRIFRSLPGLENADFVRLGSVHRNTFIDSPKVLLTSYECRAHPGLFFAGQITGVEGYVESTASGLLAGINAARRIKGLDSIELPRSTAIGSLASYVSDSERRDFQPMNISFGIIESYFEVQNKRMGKRERRLTCSERSLSDLRPFFARIETNHCLPAS